MRIERKGRSVSARQATGVDAIGAAFGFAEDGANGWHLERRNIETRSERDDFARTVNRLRVKKWQRDCPEKRAAKSKRYHSKPDVRARALENARRRRRARAQTQIFTCATCGIQWCRVPWFPFRGNPPRYCTPRCQNREMYRRSKEKRSHGSTARTASAVVVVGASLVRLRRRASPSGKKEDTWPTRPASRSNSRSSARP